MRGYVGFAFILIMLMPFITMVPDLIVYGTVSNKANMIVEQVTKEAEMLGGITPEVEQRFQEVLVDYGMDDKGFKVEYDRTGEVEYRGRFKVKLEGQYTFRAFNLLGTGVGNFTLPITAIDSGVSEVWIR